MLKATVNAVETKLTEDWRLQGEQPKEGSGRAVGNRGLRMSKQEAGCEQGQHKAGLGAEEMKCTFRGETGARC